MNTDEELAILAQQGDTQAYDRLMKRHAYLARITAMKTRVEMAEREDLIAVGICGLSKAIKTFKLGKGTTFRSWAIRVMRGTILEERRNADHVPRTVREHGRKLEALRAMFVAERGRPPSDDEVLKLTGWPPATLALVQRSVYPVGSLDAIVSGGGAHDPIHAVDLLVDPDPPADEALAHGALIEAALSKLEDLPEREAMAIDMHFFRGLTLREIGKALAVSESRALQLVQQGLKRLRDMLAGDPRAYVA